MRTLLLDYGAGNVHSAMSAFAKAGYSVERVTTPEAIEDAPLVVVPGVGHFGQCVTQCKEAGFAPALQARLQANKPTIGICVGLQILFESSEEAPGVPGLGLIPGTVRRLPAHNGEGERVTVPHIGWNPLVMRDADGPFARFDGQHVYFVHSYYAQAASEDTVVASVTHGGVAIPAMVQHGSLLAMQFHPEKSGVVGHELLCALRTQWCAPYLA